MPAKKPPAWRHALLFGALLAVTLLVYQPAWHGGTLWDDDGHLTKAELQSTDGLRRIWFEVGATQQYYPLVHSAFWMMHRLWGDGTTGYHLVNIALHALSAFLIAVLLRRLAVPGAVFAACVFALHPVHAESVAWITELKNTLSTVLYLGAAMIYLRFDGTRRRRDWVAAAGLFVLALLSKTVTATLPVSLLIVVWWKRGELSWQRDGRPIAPFVLLGVAAGAMTSWVEHALIGARGGEFGLTFVERVLLAGRAVWFYLSSLVWPAHLVFIYPRWTVSQAVWWQYFYPATVGLLLLVLWRARARTRAPLAALLLYGAALGPALGFVNVYPFRYSLVADHFQYAASIAAIAFVSAAATTAVSRWVQVAAARTALGVVVLAPLAVLTWQYSRQYVSAETLYRTTIERNPAAWMAHHNLGEMKLRGSAAELEEALAHIRESLRLNPDNAEARNSLGFALQRLGRRDEARREYEASVRLNPGFSAAHNNLGVLAYAEGRIDDATRHYREAIRLNPADPDPQRNMGIVFLDLGRAEEAAPYLQGAFARNPTSPDVLDNLGTLALRLGRPEEAIAHYEAAIGLRPEFAAARNNLGIALEKLGRLDEAERQYREALRLAPDAARTHDNLGYVLLRQGRFADAAAQLGEAIRLQSDFAPSHASLAGALQGLGRLDEAVAEYRRALAFPENAASADLHNAFGVALAQRGRVPEAIEQFREALRLNPALLDARVNLARARGR